MTCFNKVFYIVDVLINLSVYLYYLLLVNYNGMQFYNFQITVIMKLAEMCRKLETEEEKVLPFYASSLTKEEQEDVETAMLEPGYEPLAQVSF